MPDLGTAANYNQQLREAVGRGDFDHAAAVAKSIAPGMDTELAKFRLSMAAYQDAKLKLDWRRALRALADARHAAITAGLTDLEEVVTRHLYDVIKQYEGRRTQL